jgi:hypothetical protein
MTWQFTSARRACIAAALALSFFSDRGILMPQAQHSIPFSPQWQEGQKWRVEYLRNVPSTEMKSGGQIPPPQRAVWQYEVSHSDPRKGGPAILSLQEEGGDGKFEISLDPKTFVLLSVSEFSGGRNIGIITNSALDSFLSIPTGYPIIFDWPRFPAKRSNASRILVTSEGHRVKEEVLFDGDAHFKISMTYREQRAEGLVQTIHSTQSWQAGRPWWDSASAASDMIVGEEKSSYWSISGKLLP